MFENRFDLQSLLSIEVAKKKASESTREPPQAMKVVTDNSGGGMTKAAAERTLQDVDNSGEMDRTLSTPVASSKRLIFSDDNIQMLDNFSSARSDPVVVRSTPSSLTECSSTTCSGSVHLLGAGGSGGIINGINLERLKQFSLTDAQKRAYESCGKKNRGPPSNILQEKRKFIDELFERLDIENQLMSLIPFMKIVQ